ncbi:V-type ATP synthase subunit I [Fusibacter sp. 3D3]|uniref:V-type ATP synthase subunit I n=1 Tax=Fusibacter sp. 3D3 TaxID=1048380 RepID=UPI0008529824|nr:V-type ATPase 116kDa subunit family protein [Fusibacter sp. 3D3]GAU77901.1 V-type ATP synthase subunit I [Fusibacter sp. 3D3]
MAIKKLAMANIVCHREGLDELLRDMILLEKSEFIDTFLEINEGEFSIGISEEHADEILDMEDIVSLKENKEIKQYIQKLEVTLKGMQYTPKLHKNHMKGSHHFEVIKAEIDDLSCKFENLTEEVSHITARLKSLDEIQYIERLKNIDVDIGRLIKMNYFTMKFGYLTREKARKISQNQENIKAIVLHIGTHDEKEFYIILSPKSLDIEIGRILRSTNFMEIVIDESYWGTPKEMLEKIDLDTQRYKERLKEIQETTKKDIEAHSESMDRLYSKLIMERKIDQVRVKVGVTQSFAYISAWIPESKLDHYNKAFTQHQDTLVAYKKADEVSVTIPVPTRIENNSFFRPFEMLVNMYGVPSHDEIDPTVFFGIAYMFLFGAMFGDFGQGFLITLAGWFLQKKVNPQFCGILMRIGMGSMIFGIFYDSFFGYEHVISTLIPLNIYLRPMDNINLILFLAILAGLVLVYISYGYSVVNKYRAGDLEEGAFGRNGINGIVLLSSVLLLVYKQVANVAWIPIFPISLVILLCVVLLVIKHPLASWIQKKEHLYEEPPGEYYIESGFNLFETFLSLLSNSASFIRVGAFALNHVGLFIAFHTLADMTGTLGGNVIMFIIGNVIIIGLEGLVVFIQGLRLFYYELFSKYYTGEGVLFAPDKI